MSRQPKIVIVTPQLPIVYRNGGIGTFTRHFINLLLQAGCGDLSLIYTSSLDQPAKVWMPYYQERGVQVTALYDQYPQITLWEGHHQLLRLSYLVAQHIPQDADIVYFADFRANGFVPLKRRLYASGRPPVFVTVIHGPTPWHRQGQLVSPSSFSDFTTDLMEQYTAEKADFVAAPSQYTFAWALQNGWRLPPEERRFVLGYPWLPTTDPATEQPPHPAPAFKRVVFFGRLETRKGFDIFVEALLRLRGRDCLRPLEEIVFLGQEGVHIYKTTDEAASLLQKGLNIPVRAITGLDTADAQAYLRQHAADTLVVTPSRADTFGFTVIESSLIPGLNLIFSSGGGMWEVLKDAGEPQMFDPDAGLLADKLAEWLAQGPRPHDQLAHYAWRAANQRWLDFHQQVSDYARSDQPARLATPLSAHAAQPLVDVCLAISDTHRLGSTLESLAQQTTSAFNVYVVLDTESAPGSEWNRLRGRFASNANWRFIVSQTGTLIGARNLAAALGDAPYLIFMNSDQRAAPQMVARYLEAMTLASADCLTCWVQQASRSHNSSPINPAVLQPDSVSTLGIGNLAALNLLENTFGDLNCIIRRVVFEAAGGFPPGNAWMTSTHRELYTTLALQGHHIDVLPEFLCYYGADGPLRETMLAGLQHDSQIAAVYRDRLRAVNLAELAPITQALITSTQTGNMSGKFVSDDGAIVFDNRLDYLINGVGWRVLLAAMRGKALKNIRRLTRR